MQLALAQLGSPALAARRAAASRRGQRARVRAAGQERLGLVEQRGGARAVAGGGDRRGERDQPVGEVERLPPQPAQEHALLELGQRLRVAAVRGQRDAVRRVDLADLERVQQPVLARQLDRLHRQPQLLGAAPRMPAISDRSAIAATPTIHCSAAGASAAVSSSHRSARSSSPLQ